VAVFGDSFVYGTEVADADAWASRIEATYPDLEVLNYGVGGYGLDQALLRYRLEGAALQPDVVLVGFIVDDIRRVVNVYQRFASTSSGIFTKPRFRLDEEGHLELLPSPIHTLEDWRPILDDPATVVAWGKDDQWYEPLVYENPLYDFSALVRIATSGWIRLRHRYIDPDRLFLGETLNPSAEAFLLQMAIFRAFVSEVRANGAEPIIVFFPSRRELEAERDRRSQAYVPMTDQLRHEHIDYWDAKDAFAPLLASDRMNEWFEPGGHYSPAGNRIVAEWLAPKLLALGPGTSAAQ
jgi:lysophospholipase L1-like esterase